MQRQLVHVVALSRRRRVRREQDLHDGVRRAAERRKMEHRPAARILDFDGLWPRGEEGRDGRVRRTPERRVVQRHLALGRLRLQRRRVRVDECGEDGRRRAFRSGEVQRELAV
eukprot:7379761-Prymnesium_polylepis.4